MAIPQYTMTLDWSENIAPDVKHFAFTRDDGKTLDFIPGQFITLLIRQDDKLIRRSYSIATIPGQSEKIEFSANYVDKGLASELLFNLTPGDKLTFTGPHGRLVLRDEQPKRYIFIATGTGVTPYRSMLPSLAPRLQTNELSVVLLLGVRNRENCIYANEFKSFANQHPNFMFRAQYSRETSALDQKFEFSGRVQTAYAELNLNPEQDIIYLCGNPDMIDESFEQLKEKGFDAKNVRREKYISSN